MKVKKKMHSRGVSICFGLHRTADAEGLHAPQKNQTLASEIFGRDHAGGIGAAQDLPCDERL